MKTEEEAGTTTLLKGSDGVAGGGFVLGKVRYKFWLLAAVLLLAVWSMFTGSVTLKWSDGNFSPVSGSSQIREDFDILELEEREKLVRRLWDVYRYSTTIRLPRFWLEAFEAAYEDLISDVSAIRNSAALEIAKMSLQSATFESPAV